MPSVPGGRPARPWPGVDPEGRWGTGSVAAFGDPVAVERQETKPRSLNCVRVPTCRGSRGREPLVSLFRGHAARGHEGLPMEWTPRPDGIAMCQDGTEAIKSTI